MTKIDKLRKEMNDEYDLFTDMQRLMENDWNDDDAVSLETTAHRLQGMYFQLEKVEELAGELALAIDPNVQEKV